MICGTIKRMKRVVAGLICICVLTAASNDSVDLSEYPPLYRLVIEGRQTGNSSLVFMLSGNRPVAGMPEIAEMRETYRAARKQLAGSSNTVASGLAAYRELVLEGAGFPATEIWDFCLRKAEAYALSDYCNNSTRWLEAASELGDPSAMVHLGWHHARLPEPKMDLALKWFILAAAYRDSGGSAALDYWETKGVYPDSPEVQRLIRQWIDADEADLISIIHKLVGRR